MGWAASGIRSNSRRRKKSQERLAWSASSRSSTGPILAILGAAEIDALSFGTEGAGQGLPRQDAGETTGDGWLVRATTLTKRARRPPLARLRSPARPARW